MEFAKWKNSFLLALALLMSVFNATMSTDVRHDERALVIDGQRRIIISGSIHYPRSTPEMWPDLIKKAKEGGLDAIETYVFWNGHEPRPREYNFEGNYDIIRFFKEIQNAGLYAVLRIGPYICGEWNYGGLPAWLRDIPGMKFREDNEPFKREMQNFTTYIVDKVREANLFAAQGGPIILAQIENEYGNIWKAYDENSRWNYITWCADMANSLDIGVPWIMCQQQPAPSNVIDTCNGFYCHHFSPSNKNNPKFWTENWTGWFKAWDKPDFHRPAEDVAYAVARFFQTRGTFQNYYMYHGGTNFGRTSGGPYITSTYDYDAPLDEYGNLRQPKWGHLKELHTALKSMEKHLVYGEHNESRYGNITTTKYTLDGTSACFISNEDVIDLNATLEGSVYSVPAWSVSLLPDCTTVAYNTAKVKTQTSVMVKRPNTLEQEPEALQWSWMPENLKPFLTDRHGPFRTKKLLDQIVTTADQSDYLWYTTSLEHHREEKFTLYVNTTGHVLYAFVNGELVGHRHSQDWPFIFQFQAPVTLRKGRNYISLLSATVGLKNYGAYYELMPAGVVGGPVKLVGSNNNASIDVSHNTWSYETGLWGEHTHVHLEESGSKWKEGVVPVNRPFTWYKSTFQAPVGSEPVVVDLLGLNKGMAWVNGNNLGRYWPSYIANEMGGCHHCDYRGNFNTDSYKEKCLTGCGEPSQRWYHVPRSFLKAGEPNMILLFEEAGGDPSQVNFQTVATGPVCVNAEKGDAVTLSCQHGKTIARVDTASFDVTRGKCGAYEGGCESKLAYYFLTEACVGKESCTVEYTDSLHSSDCNGDKGPSVLTIQATCS